MPEESFSRTLDSLEITKIKQPTPQEAIKVLIPQFTAPDFAKIAVIPLKDTNEMLIKAPKVGILELVWLLLVNEVKYKIVSIDRSLVFIDGKPQQPFEDKKMGEFTGLLETVKGFLTGMLFRWILKIGGGFLLSVGISEGSLTEIVGAVVSIVVGLVVSLIQQKKAINTVPPVTP